MESLHHVFPRSQTQEYKQNRARFEATARESTRCAPAVPRGRAEGWGRCSGAPADGGACCCRKHAVDGANATLRGRDAAAGRGAASSAEEAPARAGEGDGAKDAADADSDSEEEEAAAAALFGKEGERAAAGAVRERAGANEGEYEDIFSDARAGPEKKRARALT
jgi:hypothetical protein